MQFLQWSYLRKHASLVPLEKINNGSGIYSKRNEKTVRSKGIWARGRGWMGEESMGGEPPGWIETVKVRDFVGGQKVRLLNLKRKKEHWFLGDLNQEYDHREMSRSKGFRKTCLPNQAKQDWTYLCPQYPIWLPLASGLTLCIIHLPVWIKRWLP